MTFALVAPGLHRSSCGRWEIKCSYPDCAEEPWTLYRVYLHRHVALMTSPYVAVLRAAAKTFEAKDAKREATRWGYAP
jgi:hypothetical protein